MSLQSVTRASDLQLGHPPGSLADCRCAPTHLGAPVDTAALNRAAAAHLAASPREHGEVDCLIVPGFTPRLGWRLATLHPHAADSCAQAAADLAAGVAPYVIVSGGAVHGPANEAVLMRAFLLARGVPEERILVDPCARHTTTNLRNAGRLMLAAGLRSAYVVTRDVTYHSRLHWVAHRFTKQAYYIGYPRLSSFHLRCRLTLGHRVGHLAWVRPGHVFFVPAAACLEGSARSAADGDP